VDRDAVRIRRGHLHGLQRLVGLRVADDHRLRAHAAQVPVLVVVRKHDVLADAATRYRDDLDAVRVFLHVDHAELALTERGDIRLALVPVIEDMVRDKIGGQRQVLHDLPEALGLRIDVYDRDAFLAGRRGDRRLQCLQRVRRLGFVVGHEMDLAGGERGHQRKHRGGANRQSVDVSHDRPLWKSFARPAEFRLLSP
jgi:hypothetical protein